jgi:small subunit ribosomal protein S6
MPNQTYDLLLIASANADSDRRAAIYASAEQLIAKGGGTVSNKTEWGERPLAFDIEHESAAEYRLIRFEAPGESLEAISRQLNITDQLLRHRIIKAVRGAPETVSAPTGTSSVSATPAPSAPAEPVAEEPVAIEEPAAEVVEAAPAEPAVGADEASDSAAE